MCIYYIYKPLCLCDVLWQQLETGIIHVSRPLPELCVNVTERKDIPRADATWF